MRKTVLILVVAVSLIGSSAFAHGGEQHKAMGTVTSIDATHIDIKDTRGKVMRIPLAPNTMFMNGDVMAKASDLRPRMRVIIETGEDGKARHVKFRAAARSKSQPQK